MVLQDTSLPIFVAKTHPPLRLNPVLRLPSLHLLVFQLVLHLVISAAVVDRSVAGMVELFVRPRRAPTLLDFSFQPRGGARFDGAFQHGYSPFLLWFFFLNLWLQRIVWRRPEV